MSERILPLSFYERPTVTVAKDLLGKVLVAGQKRARIVEVEAYLGLKDLASHARFGPTDRAKIMFGPAGRLYVYLIYGMHHCMNVVTEKNGVAGAVLLRAAWDGEFAMTLSGPGRLCKGLGITRRHNNVDLTRANKTLYLADDGFHPHRISRSPRVGVDYAGSWSRRLLRFYVPGHPAVSFKS